MDDARPKSSLTEAEAQASFVAIELVVQHYAQINGYFCGPASGKMILKWLDEGSSAYNGAVQDQPHIGGGDHMRTEINGKTSWSTGLFRIGLNRWRQGTNTGFYVDKASPSGAEFKSSLVYDIDRNYPFGADTVEFAGGVHYNGHPANQTIGHWIVAHGYTNSGDTSLFKDPSTSVWSAAKQGFSYATSTFTSRFLQSNGITW